MMMNFWRGSRAATLFAGLVWAAAGTAQQGVTDREILLGQSAVLTGPMNSNGIFYTAGAQMYFDAVNAAGGVNGRKVRVVTLDDAYDPKRAVANTKKLLHEEKVLSLFNYLGTGSAMAMIPVAAEEKVPLFAPYTGSDGVRKAGNRYIFHIRASYGDEAEKIIDHLHTLGYKRISVMYQNDNFGKAVLAVVQAAMDKRKIKPASAAPIEPNASDAKTTAANIAKGDPQAIIIGSAGNPVVAFIKEYNASGHKAQYYAPSVVSSEQLTRELGEAARGIVISQVMPFPWKPLNALVREYHKLLAAGGNKVAPSYTHFEGFVSAKIFTEALRRSGRDLTREKLIATLESMRELDLGGFVVGYDKNNRQGSRFVELTMIGRDGKFVQ